MTAPLKALMFALAIGLVGCGGGSGATAPDPAPDPAPPTDEPGAPDPSPAAPGSYLLEQINGSKPGQLVTIANPDGNVVGLYRFEATTLVMDALQTFVLGLRYTDDKTQDGIDDEGEFKQAGPVSQEGALPLTFSSGVYGDSFTGVVLGDFVAIKYDFDGDGQPETSFGFRRQQITLPAIESDR